MDHDTRPDLRIPVTVLTGFLGAGKTTLLNRALRDPAMAGVAVVINEFGEIGLDHAIAAASDDTILVLENGCLCCTVFGDLIGALNRLYYAREAGDIAPFDHVVIETSGLADPAPVLQAFLSDPTLAGLYRVCAVVAMADAVNAPGTLAAHQESVRQLALADHILITKLDMLSADESRTREADLRARLARLNPAAAILRIDDPAAIPGRILRAPAIAAAGEGARAWLNAEAYAHDHDHDHEAHHHDHAAAVDSFCYVRDAPIPRPALDLLLSALEKNCGPSLLRVKGLVNVEGEAAPAVIQGAQHLLHNIAWLDRWPDDDRRTRIVFITQDMARSDLEEIVAVLERVALRTAAARASARGLKGS